MNKKKILIFGIIIIVIVLMIFFRKYKVENNYENIILEENIIGKANEELDEETFIKVHIMGEVNNPGLIEIKEGSRLNDAIYMAGGTTDEADISKINLAYILSDGEKIYIPNFNDENSEEYNDFNETKKININVATIDELENLPGIGKSTAISIIEYRKENGRFSSVEDIKEVSGIGESKFEKIKEYISVK